MLRTQIVILPALAMVVLAASPAAAQKEVGRSVAVDEERVVEALVEIPMGSSVKYELDRGSEVVRVDRFLAEGFAYPANYGYVPDTCAGDGDALDILVLTRVPVMTGARVRARIVGVLRMVDAGEADDKLLAVPDLRGDAAFAGVRDLADVAQVDLDALEAFFRGYKRRPDGSTPVELNGWGDAAEAGRILTAARASQECATRPSGNSPQKPDPPLR